MEWWAYGVGAGIGAAIAATDIRSGRIPNRLVLALAATAWLGAFEANNWARLPGSWWVASAGFVAPWVGAFVASPRSIGAGDVKLALAVSAYVGAGGLVLASLTSVAAGVFYGVMYRRLPVPSSPEGPVGTTNEGPRCAKPFAPALLLAVAAITAATSTSYL